MVALLTSADLFACPATKLHPSETERVLEAACSVGLPCSQHDPSLPPSPRGSGIDRYFVGSDWTWVDNFLCCIRVHYWPAPRKAIDIFNREREGGRESEGEREREYSRIKVWVTVKYWTHTSIVKIPPKSSVWWTFKIETLCTFMLCVEQKGQKTQVVFLFSKCPNVVLILIWSKVTGFQGCTDGIRGPKRRSYSSYVIF